MITFKDRNRYEGDKTRVATVIETRVDTKSLSKEDFVKLMHENLTHANEMYREIAVPEAIERQNNTEKRSIEWAVKCATEYAERKWKTEKKRREYIDAQLAGARVRNAENRKKFEEQLGRLYNLFFDFSPKPGQGLPGWCVLNYDASDDFLRNCYDELTKCEWWGKAQGWVMKYECGNTSVHADSRPWIEYIFDEETDAAWHGKQKAIDDDIMAYYNSKKSGEYVGD